MSYLNKIATVSLTASVAFIAACGPKDQSADESSVPAVPKTAVIPDTPAEAITTIVHEFSKGNGEILWQAMPASYQTDLTDVVQLAGNKVDGEIYTKIASVVSRLGGIAKDKQDFIFNASFGPGPMPEEQKAKMQAAWPAVISIFESITNSQLGSVDGLKAFDGQKFFGMTVSDILKQMDQMTSLSNGDGASLAELAQIAVSVVESGDSDAVLKLLVPNQPEETQAFSKVEGKWLPADMVSEWTTGIANAKAQLAALTPEKIAETKTQTMMMVGMLEGILSQLEGAATQEQFDASLKGAMMPIMMMGMQMGGGMGAPQQSAPQMPPMLPTPAEPQQ